MPDNYRVSNNYRVSQKSKRVLYIKSISNGAFLFTLYSRRTARARLKINIDI